jgi:hypothetical protein
VAQALPKRAVSKSKFSMYLRTLCDRELYLSLFSNNPAHLSAAGIPVPLKTRPGVQLITASGREFEYEQFDILINALPNNVFHKSNGRANVDIVKSLTGLTKPMLILQPELEPEDFRNISLPNLGVSKDNLAFIPQLAGLRPDVVLVDQRREVEYEILPKGNRRLLPANDKRMALCVIDLKNITEANASYSAEVCLYAVFLSNWLHSVGKAFLKDFFVSDRVYLWRHIEMPRFTKIMGTKEGGDHAKRLAALQDDLEEGRVNYLIYMPSVRKFFSEDLPRVVQQGDQQGWDSVEYHVNPRCSSCDWLGNRTWLSPDDQKHFDAHPQHYCSRNAEVTDHLSKMGSLSKGASNVLGKAGHPKVANLVGIAPDADVLRRHSLLKKDRGQIGARAASIANNTTTVDQISKVAGLAKRLSAEYDVVVNFDAGSGFLTGIALRGVLFAPYGKQFPAADGGQPQSLKSLGESAFVIGKDNLQAEWAAVSAFIDRLATCIEDAEKLFKAQSFGTLRTQICFWEVRQYEELCNAFGRHLLNILELPGRFQRALAWIFPPEELLEKQDDVCPNIVFLRDVVMASVRQPQRFATTLLGTAEHYHHDRLTPRKIDSYYVEPLGNGVPRERIFEIWKSTTGTVRMFGRTVSIVEASERYGTALKAHTWAIASIAARLRTDLKDCIDGNAPELSMSIPSGLSGVAYDSKLWDRWSKVSTAVARTEGLNALITRAEWLEASYKAIVLTKLIKDHGSFRYEFEVSDDSTEAKIEEGDWCTLSIVGRPGFPLESAHKLGLGLPTDDKNAYTPMHKVIRAKFDQFDRVGKRITVRLEPQWYGVDAVFQAVMASGLLPLGKAPIYLLEGIPFDDSKWTTDILTEIGDPPFAKPAPEALRAMGASAAKKISKGTSPSTPVAQILWQADQLTKTEVRSNKEVQALATFATTANEHALNASQIDAVKVCAKQQLAVVWGPPGTGKTDTLVAFLHAVVREGKPCKILIAGPNYRTAEELSGRLVKNLEGDLAAACDFYWLYSRSRGAKAVVSKAKHLTLMGVPLDSNDPEFNELLGSMADDKRTTIISTTAHMVHQLTQKAGLNQSYVDELFHLVVLDESSQIPVTLALRPLSALRDDGQIIIAGDHKQMPPIQNLEPPKGAEHLVDSIQTYLIRRFAVRQEPLLINYRSNQDLVDYAKSLGYPPGLRAENKQKDLHTVVPVDGVVKTLPAGLPRTDAYRELLVPERRVTALIHDDPTSSQANELEAGLVAGLAYVVRHSMGKDLNIGIASKTTLFTDNEFFERGLGIVTPHKAQKALVLRKLMALFPKANPELVFSSVDTVERFQGGERDTIIVSFGVGDTDIIEGEEEFLLQLERTNVAVSRAKAKCIVLMPKSLAYHLPTDQAAAETSVAIKSYLEEFCGNRASIKIELDGVVRKGEVRWH